VKVKGQNGLGKNSPCEGRVARVKGLPCQLGIWQMVLGSLEGKRRKYLKS